MLDQRSAHVRLFAAVDGNGVNLLTWLSENLYHGMDDMKYAGARAAQAIVQLLLSFGQVRRTLYT